MFTNFYTVSFVIIENGQISDTGNILLANTQQMDTDALKDYIRKHLNKPGNTVVTIPYAQALDQQTFVAKGGDISNPATRVS